MGAVVDRLQVKNITLGKQAVYVDWELSAVGDGTGERLTGRATLWLDCNSRLRSVLEHFQEVCRNSVAALLCDYTFELDDNRAGTPPPSPTKPLPSRPSWEDKP